MNREGENSDDVVTALKQTPAKAEKGDTLDASRPHTSHPSRWQDAAPCLWRLCQDHREPGCDDDGPRCPETHTPVKKLTHFSTSTKACIDTTHANTGWFIHSGNTYGAPLRAQLWGGGSQNTAGPHDHPRRQACGLRGARPALQPPPAPQHRLHLLLP